MGGMCVDYLDGGLLPRETIQNRPRIILSTSKTFNISKLGNYKSDTHETWPSYVPPQHLFLSRNEAVNPLAGGGAYKEPLKLATKLTKYLHFYVT